MQVQAAKTLVIRRGIKRKKESQWGKRKKKKKNILLKRTNEGIFISPASNFPR